MYIWIIFKYSIFINHDLLLFWFLWYTKVFFFFFFFNPSALAFYHFFATRLAKSFSHRLSKNILGLKEKSWIIFPKIANYLRTDLQHSCDLKCAIFPYLGGGRIFFFFFFSFVIFYSHCFSLLSLTFSALCMWPEVALLVTGCSNEITKSSVALWLTGVFRLMLM